MPTQLEKAVEARDALWDQYLALAKQPVHTLSIHQRSAVKHKLDELMDQIERLNAMIADLDDTGDGGIALVRFGEPR